MEDFLIQGFFGLMVLVGIAGILFRRFDSKGAISDAAKQKATSIILNALKR
jgi:hypothetical protein